MSDLDELIKSLSEEGSGNKDQKSFADIINLAKEVWEYIWSKKIYILICGPLFALLGYLYAYNKTIRYTANYYFSIEGETGNAYGYSLSSLLGMGSSSMGAFYGDNLIGLMQNRAMIERTLLTKVPNKDFNFMEYAILVDSLRQKACGEDAPKAKEGVVSVCDISYPLGSKRDSLSRPQDSLLMVMADAIAENISVARVDKKLSFVSFSFTHSDETFAKEFADAYIDEVTKFYVQTKTSRTQKNLEMFQAQADSIRRKYEAALYSRAAHADLNMNVTRQIGNVENQKKQAEIQISLTAYSEIIKNIQVLKLDLAKESPLIQIIQKPHYPLGNDKMRKLKAIFIGGVLGGFLSCGVLIAIFFIKKMKKDYDTLMLNRGEKE